MNALARIVRNLTLGREPSQADLGILSPQESAALQKLQACVARSPRDVAGVLAAIGPQEIWLSPTPAPKQTAC